jgi:hypothetical protein
MSNSLEWKATSQFTYKNGGHVGFINGYEFHIICVKNIETGIEYMIGTLKHGKDFSEPIQFGDLEFLEKYGLNISTEEWGLFKLYIGENRFNIPLYYYYETIGYQQHHNGEVFYHGVELISLVDNVKTAVAASLSTDNNEAEIIYDNDGTACITVSGFNITNRSNGIYLLSDSSSHTKSNGSDDVVINLINQVIQGRELAQVILAVGFSSVIVGLLELKTIMLNIVGRSSIGKSRLCQLVTSIFSKTTDSKITATFDATPKSLESFMHNNFGVTTIIDDASTDQDKQHKGNKLIYMLEKGESRLRLAKDYKVTPKFTWHTSIITTSEESVLADCERDKLGVIRRIIEVEAFQGDLTEDSKMAKEIQIVTKNNYGVLATSLIKKLVENNYTKEAISEMLEEEIIKVQAISDKSGIMQGFAETVAVITLTAELVRSLLNVSFEVDVLRKSLLDIGIEMVAKMEVGKDGSISFAEAYVELLKVSDVYKLVANSDSYINMPTETFKQLSKRLGISCTKFKKELYEKKLLRTDVNRLDKSIKVNGKTERFISFLNNYEATKT